MINTCVIFFFRGTNKLVYFLNSFAQIDWHNPEHLLLLVPPTYWRWIQIFFFCSWLHSLKNKRISSQVWNTSSLLALTLVVLRVRLEWLKLYIFSPALLTGNCIHDITQLLMLWDELLANGSWSFKRAVSQRSCESGKKKKILFQIVCQLKSD